MSKGRSKLKKILFLAYHYPPAKNGAVARFDSFFKHLPDFGFEPIIFTIKHYDYTKKEKNIFRFNSLSTIKRKALIRRFYYKRIKDFYSLLDPTLDFIWQKSIEDFFPEFLKNNKISTIYGSFPPTVSLYLGLKLSRKYNIPLVSEYRDGYAFESIISKKSVFNNYFFNHFEKKVTNHSLLTITVSNVLTEYFKEHYKIENVHTVFNGFEKSDFEGLNFQQQNSKKIKIVNFGSICISKKRNVSYLFDAIFKLKNEKIINENNFELSLIGKYSKEEKNLINKKNINDLVKIYAPMDKKEGFQKIINEYNYLLLYGLPDETYVIPSKTFEYINLKLPILGICKNNEAERIILETSTGEISGFSTNEVYDLFKKAIENKINYQPDYSKIEKYDRKNQAKELSSILDKYLF